MSAAKFLLAAVAALVVAGPAVAQSLEAKKMYQREEASLKDKVAYTNRKCGGALQVKVEWSTFNAEEILQKNVSSWCSAALDAIEDLCDDDLGKQAVNEKVKTLTCAGAAEPSAKVDAGNLTFSFALGPNQNKLLVRTYLEKNL
jgi:hypothetical protein